MSTTAEFANAYRGLREHGTLVCRVEDAHAGRWWPSYALRALRHREADSCGPRFRRSQRCADCRRARRGGFIQ